ncbi:hypothetical protein, partial [Streptomyces cyaneofuscatus]|uniref:hypothetical protein n=1 Tax=Streptomyces cyaneofuscatus TaxID=66883 RepID=UPI003475B35B
GDGGVINLPAIVVIAMAATLLVRGSPWIPEDRNAQALIVVFKQPGWGNLGKLNGSVNKDTLLPTKATKVTLSKDPKNPVLIGNRVASLKNSHNGSRATKDEIRVLVTEGFSVTKGKIDGTVTFAELRARNADAFTVAFKQPGWEDLGKMTAGFINSDTGLPAFPTEVTLFKYPKKPVFVGHRVSNLKAADSTTTVSDAEKEVLVAAGFSVTGGGKIGPRPAGVRGPSTPYPPHAVPAPGMSQGLYPETLHAPAGVPHHQPWPPAGQAAAPSTAYAPVVPTSLPYDYHVPGPANTTATTARAATAVTGWLPDQMDPWVQDIPVQGETPPIPAGAAGTYPAPAPAADVRRSSPHATTTPTIKALPPTTYQASSGYGALATAGGNYLNVYSQQPNTSVAQAAATQPVPGAQNQPIPPTTNFHATYPTPHNQMRNQPGR